jgi:hypothetical protein
MKKRAKSTEVIQEEYVTTMSVYKCPHCRTKVRDYSLRTTVTREICGYCHREIIYIRKEKENE